MTPRGAVFLDRDNTLVEDLGYLHDPAAVRLLPGVAAGLAEIQANGWPLVVVSNQSGMARGMFGPAEWEAVMRQLERLLQEHGVRLTASYYCPHHPDFSGPCDCRKPGVKLFRDAAAAHRLDLGSSWFIGDRWSDVEPALTLGGRGILLNADPLSDEAHSAARHAIRSVGSLTEAAPIIGKRA